MHRPFTVYPFLSWIAHSINQEHYIWHCKANLEHSNTEGYPVQSPNWWKHRESKLKRSSKNSEKNHECTSRSTLSTYKFPRSNSSYTCSYKKDKFGLHLNVNDLAQTYTCRYRHHAGVPTACRAALPWLGTFLCLRAMPAWCRIGVTDIAVPLHHWSTTKLIVTVSATSSRCLPDSSLHFQSRSTTIC